MMLFENHSMLIQNIVGVALANTPFTTHPHNPGTKAPVTLTEMDAVLPWTVMIWIPQLGNC